MPGLTTVSKIQAHLSENGPEMHRRFATLLAEALNGYDLAQIRRLVTAAKSAARERPYLRQWRSYAQGLLELEESRRPAAAIAQLESLRAQKESLAPQLGSRVLNSLGIAYEKNEQWDRARECYQECIEQAQLDNDDLALGKAYSNLAIVHYKGLDFEAAATSAEHAISILGKNTDDRNWQIPLARAWNELGLASMQSGSLAEAQQAFEHYLAISTRWEYRFGQGIAYTNLAHVARRLGQIQKAEKQYRLARDISLQVGNTFEAAEAVYGLGLTHVQAETSPAQIEAAFDRALTLAREANNHEITTQIFLSRADLQDRQGYQGLALAENRRAVQTVESLRANIVLPEARIRLQGSRIEAYEKMVSRLGQTGTSSAYAEAFQYAEMAKSRALIEMLAGRPVRRPENIPAAWLAEEDALRQALHRLYEEPHANQARIDSLEAELEQLRQRIRLRHAEFESFHTVSPIPLEEVMERLPPDGLLVEYFTAGDDIWAFTVTAGTIKGTRLPLKVTELGRAFERSGGKLGQLRHLSRGPDQRLPHPWILEKLYHLLLEPLGPIVQTASLVCLVPHGLLHYVPFHALYQRTAAGPDYFVAGPSSRRIIYAPSATTLFGYCRRKRPSPQTGCLAIGYNDLSLPAPLTQAETEAETIARITTGRSLTGEQATRTAVFEEARHYRYLHCSCHGWFNPTWPMASSLSLADGHLDVTDILRSLRLEADLVSLSACETGRSHILRGDELIGLVRAFLYAGTPSVLVSHWVVDELATRLLMEQFYRELMAYASPFEIGSKAKALGRAQKVIKELTVEELRDWLAAEGMSKAEQERHLQYLATSAGYDSVNSLSEDMRLLAHPYYWASFFLVGDQL